MVAILDLSSVIGVGQWVKDECDALRIHPTVERIREVVRVCQDAQIQIQVLISGIDNSIDRLLIRVGTSSAAASIVDRLIQTKHQLREAYETYDVILDSFMRVLRIN